MRRSLRDWGWTKGSSSRAVRPPECGFGAAVSAASRAPTLSHAEVQPRQSSPCQTNRQRVAPRSSGEVLRTNCHVPVVSGSIPAGQGCEADIGPGSLRRPGGSRRRDRAATRKWTPRRGRGQATRPVHAPVRRGRCALARKRSTPAGRRRPDRAAAAWRSRCRDGRPPGQPGLRCVARWRAPDRLAARAASAPPPRAAPRRRPARVTGAGRAGCR